MAKKISELTELNISAITDNDLMEVSQDAGEGAYTSKKMKIKLKDAAAKAIHDATAKDTPVDNDEVGIIDSEASNVLKKTLWSKIKSTLKTYFDTLYLHGKEQSIVCADAVTIDWSTGATAYMTFDRATVAFTFSNPVAGGIYHLKLKQDAIGSRTATWSTTIKWLAKTAPTLTTAANAEDILIFVYINSEWFGDIKTNFGTTI